MNAVARGLGWPLSPIRTLVLFEGLLLLLPSMFVVGMMLCFETLLASDGSPDYVVTATMLALVMLGQLATAYACWLFVRRGGEGLSPLPAWCVVVMQACAWILLVAVLAIALDQWDFEALQIFDVGVFGLPTLVPLAHMLFERRRAPQVSARRLILAGATLALTVLALQWFVSGPLPFDRASWNALAQKPGDRWHRRGRMADGLRASGRLEGLQRAEVVALLGEPDSFEYHGSGINYNLGDARGFMSSFEELEIRFDAKGKVDDVVVFSD